MAFSKADELLKALCKWNIRIYGTEVPLSKDGCPVSISAKCRRERCLSAVHRLEATSYAMHTTAKIVATGKNAGS